MRIWKQNALQKAVSVLLCLVMVLGMLPVPAFAEESIAQPCIHAGGSATCAAPAVCESCGEAYGEPADHNYVEGKCSVCEVAQPHTHSYIKGVCSCGTECSHIYVEGVCTGCGTAETHIHIGGSATCKELANCEKCGTAYGELTGHDYATDGKCDNCGAECVHSFVNGVCACGMMESEQEPECCCGVKCNKVYQDEECLFCSEGNYEDCAGNEISAFLTGDYTGNGTMQYNQSGTTIDVQGAGNVKTTYSDNGYYLKTTDNLSGKVAASANFANGGSYVKLSYTVTNDTDSQIAGAIGICADVQIGTDDKATITAIKNAKGTAVIGLKMVDTNSTGNLQFNLYFRGTAGVTNADRYWIGPYASGSYKNEWNTDSNAESYSGGDSALAVSWNVNLGAGESKIYSVIVGVGEVANPPQFRNDAVSLTMSAEATPDNLLIHVNAKAKDASGVIDTLYYNENGGAEQKLGNSVVGDGETEKEITGVIDLTGKSDGTYKYQFWIVNDKGAASEVVERTITIANGEVTGDITTIKVPVTGITVNPSSLTMYVGKTTELAAAITPDNATNKNIRWGSNDAAVAKVDQNGMVTAAGSGETTITVTAEDGSGKSAACTVHVHGWSYQKKDGALDTITAKCSVSSCDAGNILKIAKPTLTVYGGTGSKEATLTASEGSVFDTTNLTVQYRTSDGTDLNAAPTDAGTYIAGVTVGESGNTVTASVEYTIAKAANSVTPPVAKTLTYNGQAQELVTAAVCGHGTVYYSLDGTNYSTAIPKGTNAGDYTVFYKVAGDKNHQNIEPQTVTVTISRKSLADAEVTLSDTVIFKGQPIPKLTVKDESTTLEENRDYTVAQSGRDGEFTMIITGTGNYKDDASVKPTYLVVALPVDPEPDDKTAIDVYDHYAKFNEIYKDAELKKALEKVYEDLTAYDITHQSASYHTKGSGKTLTFTANGYYAEYGSYTANAYGKFVSVEVDDKVTSSGNYTAAAGSTVITLKASYLDTLTTGKHTIKVNYTDGSTDGEDTFRISVNNGNPFTGDDTHMMLFIGVALTSLLCMAMMIVFFPRKKGKYEQ